MGNLRNQNKKTRGKREKEGVVALSCVHVGFFVIGCLRRKD
jgi:hypothetical protein